MFTSKKLMAKAARKIKNKDNIESISGLSRELEVTRATIHRWQRGYTMDDDNALKIAYFLKLDPDYVLACIHAERAIDTESYPTWQRIAERVKLSQLPKKSPA